MLLLTVTDLQEMHPIYCDEHGADDCSLILRTGEIVYCPRDWFCAETPTKILSFGVTLTQIMYLGDRDTLARCWFW